MEQTPKAYPSPKPKVPKEEAIRRIREQIEIGRAIKNTALYSMMDLDDAQKRRTEWLENQTQILSILFNDSFLEEGNSKDISFDIDSAITFGLKEKYFKDDINEKIGRLESFLERLKRGGGEDLMEEPMRQEQVQAIRPKEAQAGVDPAKERTSKDKLTRREPCGEPPSIEKPNVLFIYGQDGTVSGSVLEFIENLGLRALTTHEQASEGKSLIENFREISNIRFAIVLITPDDATPQKKVRGTRTRGSYDIIFEFGYAVAKLGHKRVCALCQEGAEIPFDDPGGVFIPMDTRGGWRLLLAREIKEAGIEIDLNKAI